MKTTKNFKKAFLNIEKSVLKGIKKSLRDEYKTRSSAIKRICRETGIAPRVIRNWYQASNLPSAIHLIILARSYRSIFRLLLDLTGYQHLSAQLDMKNVPINVPNDVSYDRLTERQQWILTRICLDCPLTSKIVAKLWGISERTVKRDMTVLMYRGYIIHIGSRKGGRYILRTFNTDIEFGAPDYLGKPPPISIEKSSHMKKTNVPK